MAAEDLVNVLIVCQLCSYMMSSAVCLPLSNNHLERAPLNKVSSDLLSMRTWRGYICKGS